MSQFADRKHIVTAIKFDGSDASALAIVKAFGSGVAMSAKDGVITLTLNRPQAFNSLSEAMLAALARVTAEGRDTSRDPRVAILTALAATGGATRRRARK